MRVHIFGPLPRQREQIRRAMPAGVKPVFHGSAKSASGGTAAVVWAAFLGHTEVARVRREIPHSAVVTERSLEAVVAAAKQVAGK